MAYSAELAVTACYSLELGTILVNALQPYNNSLTGCVHLSLCWYRAQEYINSDLQTGRGQSAPPVLFLRPKDQATQFHKKAEDIIFVLSDIRANQKADFYITKTSI